MQNYLATIHTIIRAILFVPCPAIYAIRVPEGAVCTIGLPQAGPPQDVVVVVISSNQRFDDNVDDDEMTPAILQHSMTVDTDEQLCV
jgi:hypothetical protein